MASPKLRFKEFDGDWCISPLKNLCKINQGLQIAIEERFLEDAENRFFYITNEFLRDGAKKSYFIENPPISVRCKSEDILMTRTGNTGQVVTNVEGAFHNNFFKIDFDRKQIDKNFFVEFLRKNTTQHLILKYAGASTIPDLNHSDFYRIQMPITSIDEQTKIASFLSAVDEKISQLTQKHELLSQYKQGMMQKLFSQQIRFKADDGSEFGEWEKLTLSQISKHIGGTALESYVSECGDYNFISIGNYSTNGKYIDNSQRIILNEKTGTKLLDKDDLVMVLNDKTATGDLIGSTILINEDNKYIYNQRSERIICNKSKVLSVYLWHFLNSEMMRSEVRKLAQGGTQIYINFSSVLSIIFLLPCLAEQNKIANFLSSIDQKIEVVAQQIEHAKQWKKGLLQQMFV